MTIKEIENYLSLKNLHFDDCVGKRIEDLRQNAIRMQDEEQADYCWCLGQIYKVQKGFVFAINALKAQKYEDAWNTFDRIDIDLSYLENNFNIAQEYDKYHLIFIGRMIKEYQKLFPYCHFLSRECIIKAEECSICGKLISLRHPCGHKVGKLYMGELCLRKVTDIEFKALSIVTDPFDKYAYIQLPDQEYNYGMLEHLMTEIDQPYDDFSIETIRVQNPKYKGIERNALCPCGSGRKYKKCHWGTDDELIDHHIIHLAKPAARTNRFVGTFGTWK